MVPDVQSKLVLVIDDDPDVARAIKQVIETGGHQVRCAFTGQKAIEAMRTARFDVIVTDVFMPECDGIEIVVAARRQNPAATIIAISGGGTYMTTGDALKVSRALGATHCLHKPFTAPQLLELIGRCALADAPGDPESN
jgi:CheY-like chemotaxis protein